MAIKYYDSLNVDSNNDSYFLGDVGIGATSPSAELHVVGSARVTGAYYDSGNLPGTATQVLSSTATGTSWVDQSTINAGNAEHVVIYAKNTSGSQIDKGTPVYITGTVGATDTVQIAPADAGNSAKMPAVGLLDDTLINNAFGYVITGGFMDNITTDPIDGATPASNDTVYVKVGGGLTLTKPTGPTGLIQNIAKVGKVSGGNAGSLIVSSILRTNDVPNLTTGKIWVGNGNTVESTVVHLDEANGRMGIGTANPSAKLTVEDNSGIFRVNTSTSIYPRIELGGSATGSTAAVFNRVTSSQDIKFGEDVDTGRYIFRGGNVGIGTTSPSERLEVAGNIQISDADGYLQFKDTNASSGNSIRRIYNAEQDLYFSRRNDDGSLQSNDMVINSTGNIGIGTSSPTEKLYVNSTSGDVRIGLNAPTGSDTEIKFSNNGVVEYTIGHDDATDNFVIGTTNVDAPKLVVNKSGNVGIGTTSPGEKLDVNGTVNLTNIKIATEQGTDGQVLTSTGSGIAWEDVSGGSSPWTADTNGITYTAGNVGIGGASSVGFDLRVVGLSRFNSDVRFDGEVNVAGSNLVLNNSLLDVNGVSGTSGQILSSEGSGGGVEWIDAGVTSDISEGGSGSVVIGNMVKISQTDYGNLGVPDADTLYFIVG